jgi:HD-GYP domain-containing protein (c-di-GMP phosphodiesterase class II)
MKTPKLVCPVHTLDYKVLLPGDKELTPEVLDQLIETNKGASYKTIPFLEYGTLFKDLRGFLKEPPYDTIFQGINRAVALTMMNKVSFIPPLLEFFDYFKKNDSYTYRHSLVVFALSVLMAQDLLEKTEDWIIESMAGMIHDYGKVSVPLKILNKTDPLTNVDKIILEHHALAGFVLLSYFLQDHGRFAPWAAKEHHERKDGSGYPLGIPLKDKMVEIIAISDIYDALLSPRPHRPTPYDNRTALEELTGMAKKGQIGWEGVQTLVSYNRKDRPHFKEVNVSTEVRGAPPTDTVYGVVEEKIKCPNCHGTAYELKTVKEGKEHITYECRGCGKEFNHDDMLNIELGKH